MKRRFAAVAALTLACSGALAADLKWKRIDLTDKFYAEGANAADFNKDGKLDVVYGPYWWEGPDFTRKHEIFKPTGNQPEGSWKADGDYSRDAFFAFPYDFNNDGYADYLVVAFPGDPAKLYMNPGAAGGEWKMHVVFDVVDNESVQFADFDGDGKPELICNTRSKNWIKQPAPGPDGKRKTVGAVGFARPDWSDPTKPWTFTPCSESREYFFHFTHGLGFGDVNGDGKSDFMEARSWWENTGAGLFKEHPYPFGQGGSHMFAYDVDGDGLNDVIAAQQAHGIGLAWFQQGPRNDQGHPAWTKHTIMSDKDYTPNRQGIVFSQLHALTLVDMNGDGLKDIVTGKRYFAHHSKGDIKPLDPPVLYWFELKRNADKSVEWVGHQIDDNSGVGVQIEAKDVNGDGKPDVIVGNKKGAVLFLQQ